MAGKAIVLVRRCKTPEGWRRYPAAYGKNGRVRPGYVEVGGQQRYYETGTYEIRYYDRGKLVYRPAGDSASEALAMRDRTERQWHAKAVAEDAGIVVVDVPQRVHIPSKLAEMVRDALHRGAREAAAMNKRIISEFVTITRYTHADEITRDGVYAWHLALRKKGNVDRTINLKHSRLVAFYKFSGLDRASLPPAPKYEKTLPTVYDPARLGELMRSLDDRLSLVMAVFLQCGLRDQELVHLQITDIDFRHETLRVRSKPGYDFKVKDSEERDVPVGDELLARLKAWDQSHGGPLLFATSGGKPDYKLLRSLKRPQSMLGSTAARVEGASVSSGSAGSGNFTSSDGPT